MPTELIRSIVRLNSAACLIVDRYISKNVAPINCVRIPAAAPIPPETLDVLGSRIAAPTPPQHYAETSADRQDALTKNIKILR